MSVARTHYRLVRRNKALLDATQSICCRHRLQRRLQCFLRYRRRALCDGHSRMETCHSDDVLLVWVVQSNASERGRKSKEVTSEINLRYMLRFKGQPTIIYRMRILLLRHKFVTSVPRACNTERFTANLSHLQDDLHIFEHRLEGQPEVPTGEPVDAAGAEVVDIWEGLLELFLREKIHTCISAYIRWVSSAERSVDFGKRYDIVLHNGPNYRGIAIRSQVVRLAQGP